MNIRDAINALVVLEETLEISDPVHLRVVKAYNYFPPQNVVLPVWPAMTNSWDLTSWQGANGLLVRAYAIHMQLFAQPLADGEDDRGADIATAFMEPMSDLIVANQTLTASVTQARLRGSSPTLAILERAGRSWIGLDLYLDLEMKEGKGFS